MQVGRREGDCGEDRHGVRVRHGLYERALHDGEVHDEGVLHGEDGGDGEALQESRGGYEGWASETKAHRHEVVEDGRLPRAREVEKVLCDHLCHDGQGREVHGAHVVHEEDHVFYRDEPKGPRTPDPRKD